MKVILYSEQTPDGMTVDWPAIPQVGSFIRFAHRGGTDNLEVKSVDWNVSTTGAFGSVEVHLSF